MCVLCELKQEIDYRSNLPNRKLKPVLDSWERARMRAMSTLPFEKLNLFLKKIDKHFFKIIQGS